MKTTINSTFIRRMRPLLAALPVLLLQFAAAAPACAEPGYKAQIAHAEPRRQPPPHAPARRAGGPFEGLTCGAVLDRPGYYKLEEHLVCPDVAIEITADDVHLDFAGYSVTCDQTGDAFGVLVRDVTGVTIKNGTVSDCALGIFLFGTSNSSVRQMTLSDNDLGYEEGDPSGLLMNSADDNAIIQNVMTGNGHGISLFDSSGNRIIGNDSSDNRFDGLRLLPLSPAGGSHDNHIVNNRFNRNDPALNWFSSGVQWFGPSTGNVFLRNETNDNGFLGVLVYGETLGGFPVPTGNLIQSNTALGNTFGFDLFEFDFSTFEPPPTCQNEWKNNTFGAELGPEMCIR